MASRLNIAALARRTGVRPDTLRKWELRYDVLRPERTKGGQRRYTERDVARVEWLQARLADGYRIGEAVALLGPREEEPARTPGELADALYAAVADREPVSIGALVDQALALHGTAAGLVDVVAPALARVGDGWATGELSVGQEHLFSGVVRSHLDRLLADSRGSIRGLAVLACAPGERHELGLMMLAVLLAADGWQTAYLGTDTPAADAAGLAESLSARLLCVSASTPERLAEVARAPAGTTLVVGGPGSSVAAARRLGARHEGAALPAAVEALRSLAG